MATQVVYSRYKDGGYPVRIIKDSNRVEYLIEKPEAKILCPNKQVLLATLRGVEYKGPNYSFDKYFKLGIYSKGDNLPAPDVSIFNIFRQPQQLGIDLAKRGGEVKKLLFSGFGNWIRSSGLDPEDVLQEVYKGILIRNNGTCPFDPRIASFGHYVHQICHCVLSNYQKKMSKFRKEYSAYRIDSDDNEKDVATTFVDPKSKNVLFTDNNMAIQDIQRRLKTKDALAIKILPYLSEGYERKEIATELGVTNANIARAVKALKLAAKGW